MNNGHVVTVWAYLRKGRDIFQLLSCEGKVNHRRCENFYHHVLCNFLSFNVSSLVQTSTNPFNHLINFRIPDEGISCQEGSFYLIHMCLLRKIGGKGKKGCD